MIRAILCLLFLASPLYAQNPVALRTSDPKFAPRWVDVSAPTVSLTLRDRFAGYTAGMRTPGSYEIAYAFVDETFKVSPYSPPVTINPTTHDWDCVGTTPGTPLWTRAVGIHWVKRAAGETAWETFGVDLNRQHQGTTIYPYKSITGWDHAWGGHWLYQAGTFAAFVPQSSTSLTAAPPAPVIRLLECPNSAYDVAYSWACNQGETALSPIISVPAKAGAADNRHAPISLIRSLANGVGQPPQGALGMFVYMRKPGGQWHRQPCPDGHTGYLWALDVVMPTLYQYVESNIQPGPATGKSYLSSLHLALRDWCRDVIVDNDQVICCPLVSEWSGATWDYQPRNQYLASFNIGMIRPGTWRLTIDGVTTPPMQNDHNYAGGWAAWTPILDATYGEGNVTISDFWTSIAPKIELAGKYAATDMTGKFSIEVKDGSGMVVDSNIVGTQTGRGWVMSTGGNKFKRKISTSNAGNWKVQDAATTPDGTTGYPMGWPLWVEFSQRTKLVGCDFTLMFSNCGIATADNNGGGCFHFNPVECSVDPHPSNPNSVTFGFRCIGSSSWGYGGHLCSELIMEKCHLQAKFPIVCEGNQAANWQIRDGNCYSNGTFDSAIITQANAGSIYCGGRFTADNARTLVASVWAGKTTFENLWIDGGMPAITSYNANSWSKTTILGGKINQWLPSYERTIAALVQHGYNSEQLSTLDWQALSPIAFAELSYLHAIESPTGSVEAYVQKLVTDNLDSQSNGPVQAKVINPKAGQAVYAPRVPSEVPSLLGSILP